MTNIVASLIQAARLLLAHVTVANVKDAVAVVFPNLAIYSVGSNNLTLIDQWGNNLQCLEHFNLIKATGEHQNLGPNEQWPTIRHMTYTHANNNMSVSDYEEYLRTTVMHFVQQHLDKQPTPITHDEISHCLLAKLDALRSFFPNDQGVNKLVYHVTNGNFKQSDVKLFLEADRHDMLQAFHDFIKDQTFLNAAPEENPRTTSEQLEALYNSNLPRSRNVAIVSHPNASPDFLERVANAPRVEPDVLTCVAANPNTPWPVISKWLNNKKNTKGDIGWCCR